MVKSQYNLAGGIAKPHKGGKRLYTKGTVRNSIMTRGQRIPGNGF